MSVRAIDLRRGMGVMKDSNIWVCWSNEHVQKGKGPSCNQIELRNAKTGQIIRNRYRPDETFEEVFFDRKQMEYLYSDAKSHILMDNETYEQVEMPLEMIGEKSVYLAPNIAIDVAVVEGEILTVELPNTVELTVEDTPPQVKGATATNQLKEAICEGGAKIRVPPFVENGTVVKVDTRTGEYLGRA
jgi:elongation factor P